MPLKPTSELRFIQRMVDGQVDKIAPNEFVVRKRVQHILQQKWAIDQAGAGVYIANPQDFDKWMDVPLVEESTDAGR